jgi:methyl-accepting chemotaxis protein
MNTASNRPAESLDDILRPQRAQAELLMLYTLAFLALISLILGGVMDNLSVALLVGVPALLAPYLIYRSAPGSLVTRLATSSAFMVFAALQI